MSEIMTTRRTNIDPVTGKPIPPHITMAPGYNRRKYVISNYPWLKIKYVAPKGSEGYAKLTLCCGQPECKTSASDFFDLVIHYKQCHRDIWDKNAPKPLVTRERIVEEVVNPLENVQKGIILLALRQSIEIIVEWATVELLKQNVSLKEENSKLRVRLGKIAMIITEG